MEERRHTEVIVEKLQLHGRHALDVGCGEGALTRFLAKQGADPVGIDPNFDALRRACAGHEGQARFVRGRAEQLPFPDRAFDVVVFFNSLHHVPVEQQPGALAEAQRVLRPGGHVYVQEPLAEGDLFELARAVDDETALRAAAYRAICQAHEAGLNPVSDVLYASPVIFATFEDWVARATSVDPTRAGKIAEIEAELREIFERLGSPREEGRCFRQPARVNLLQRL